MIETVKHLMNCGFRIRYAYTQSDEISLLFHFNEETFNRKLRKYHSVLAAEASAKFSLEPKPLGFESVSKSKVIQKKSDIHFFPVFRDKMKRQKWYIIFLELLKYLKSRIRKLYRAKYRLS